MDLIVQRELRALHNTGQRPDPQLLVRACAGRCNNPLAGQGRRLFNASICLSLIGCWAFGRVTGSTIMVASARDAVLRDVSLAAHTSLGLGGPAQYFARVDRAEALPEWLDWAARQSLPVTLLGGG